MWAKALVFSVFGPNLLCCMSFSGYIGSVRRPRQHGGTLVRLEEFFKYLIIRERLDKPSNGVSVVVEPVMDGFEQAVH